MIFAGACGVEGILGGPYVMRAKDDAVGGPSNASQGHSNRTCSPSGGCTVESDRELGLAGFERHQKPSIYSANCRPWPMNRFTRAKRAGRNRIELAAGAAA